MTVIFQYTILIDNNNFTRNRPFYDEFDLYFGLFYTKHGSVSGTCMCTISMSLRQLRSKKFLCSKIGKSKWAVTSMVSDMISTQVSCSLTSTQYNSFLLHIICGFIWCSISLQKWDLFGIFLLMGMNILFFKKKSMKYILNFVYWNFLFFNQIFLKNMYNCAMRLDFFSMFFFSF